MMAAIRLMLVFLTYGLVTGNKVQADDLKALGETISEFGFDLYKALYANHKDGNIFISPYSISTALAMTYLGARNDTANQMYKAMHMSDLNNNTNIHQAYQQMTNQLAKSSGDFVFNTANKIFGQLGYTFLQSFLHDVDKYYNAPLKQLDFEKDPEGSRMFVNSWVANVTKQKIQHLMPEGSIKADTKLVLANAVFFNGTWMYKFNASKTQMQPFTTLDGTKVNVPMMNDKIRLNWTFVDGLDSQMIELPYRSGHNNDTSMYIILPNTFSGFNKLEQGLNKAIFDMALKKMHKLLLNVSMPRFHLTEHYDMHDTFTSLGMGDLFTPEADLSGMDGSHSLYMSAFQHKAFINVTESGTVAAAASGGSAAGGMPHMPTAFTMDHPFMLLIRHRIMGTLFMGRMSCVVGKNNCT